MWNKVNINQPINAHINPNQKVTATTIIYDDAGKQVSIQTNTLSSSSNNKATAHQNFTIDKPTLWSIENPYLYKAVTSLSVNGHIEDEYTTSFGVRYFKFDAAKGFWRD